MAKKRRIRWVWVAVIAVLALIVAKAVVGELTKKVDIRAAAATEGSITAYVEERARTSLPHIYHVTMPLQGRVLTINVQEGDQVTHGQMVAQLEDVDWRDTASQVDDITKAFENWLKASAAQVKANQIRRDFTKWEWEKNEKLIKSRAVSERQHRDSRRRYLDSSVRIEESQSLYHATEAFNSIVQLIPGYVARNLERTVVKSPVSGTVLRRHVWNEKVMSPGAPLLDLGDLSTLEVTADILTEEAVRIQAGDRVEIFGEAIGDTPILGSVRLVEPEAFKTMSSLGVEQQRVAVRISFAPGSLETLKQSGRDLGLFYRVRVRVFTDEKERALHVRRTALFRGIDGGWQLYRVDKGRANLVNVGVGLMNDHQAEIVEGLAAGETVIIAPESSISDGTRVAAME
jgi:HlyD family secretion protein